MFGIEFAPLNIPMKRRLQTAAILQWCLCFLLLGHSCCILAIVLLFTRWWWFSVLYTCWVIFYDLNTPHTGGRRSPWVRSWRVWRYMAEYFPIELVKSVDLDPEKNYVFGFHPHGVLSAGAFVNFSTEGTNFSEKFPGIRPHLLILTGIFWMPWHRDYVMSSGCCAVSRESVEWILTRQGTGNAAVIVVGGAIESLDAAPGKSTLTIKKRKGFIRMAMKHGADLVPVYSFGENEVYTQLNNPPGSFLRSFQTKLQRFTGFATPLFHGRGVFQYTFGIVPYRKPIHTIVGTPIPVDKNENPTEEEVEALQKKYIAELTVLFDKYKHLYDMGDHELDIQ